MANRLVLTFLFVMLAGGFMGTYAQSSTASTDTTAATSTSAASTTAASSSVASTTAASSSATPTIVANTAPTAVANSAPTAVANTAPTAVANTAPTAVANSAPTAVANSAPTAVANTAPTAVANSAPTSVANSAPTTVASTAPTTVASTAPTTGNVTTTAPPIISNSTVTTLTSTISAGSCGQTQLCARQPSGCDPATGTGCFFLGVQQLSGQNFEFSLSGNSSGYIAVILSPTLTLGNNATTYICANNNGVVQYFSALLTNGTLAITTLPVNNVRGSVSGSKIQCIFDVTVPDSSQKAAAAFSQSVATGSYNASSGGLGSPTTLIRTNVVDLTNVNATITNQIASNTTSNNALTIQQSLTQALLITVGVLSLTML